MHVLTSAPAPASAPASAPAPAPAPSGHLVKVGSISTPLHSGHDRRSHAPLQQPCPVKALHIKVTMWIFALEN